VEKTSYSHAYKRYSPAFAIIGTLGSAWLRLSGHHTLYVTFWMWVPLAVVGILATAACLAYRVAIEGNTVAKQTILNTRKLQIGPTTRARVTFRNRHKVLEITTNDAHMRIAIDMLVNGNELAKAVHDQVAPENWSGPTYYNESGFHFELPKE
jgi:hypothetical protein